MADSMTAFVPYGGGEHAAALVRELRAGGVARVVTLSAGGARLDGCDALDVDAPASGATMRAIAAHAGEGHVLLVLNDAPLRAGAFMAPRLRDAALAVGAAIVYSDYVEEKAGRLQPHPTIDYQPGSLRDDFNFGAVVLLDAAMLRAAAAEIPGEARFAGWYALRLALSRRGPVFRLPEPLYTRLEQDVRRTGEKQHDYVDPRNRAVQIEMEAACTDHLRRIGGLLKPSFAAVDLDAGQFPVEASVIIPVRNRVKTVGDAVRSVLAQQAPFAFNCIVVDNHSTDGTTDLLRGLAAGDARLVHHIPARLDLGIGGCWNEAAFHALCGRFAVQLDSDDLYAGTDTLTRIVAAFRAERVGMVVGSYRMVNFDLKEIPPGVIDHREWTPENGRNNALRINGLGAPRAFFTPLLRSIRVPNVSYGEDYAVALAISRRHQIGRLYDPVYLCRRWEGNSDADLDVARYNAYTTYKDRVRTMELAARQAMNRAGA